MAHTKEVPNLVINIPEMDEYYFGKLIYFQNPVEFLVFIGCKPFDQPG